LYGGYALRKYRFERERSKIVEFEYKRKAIPFLQAIQDRRQLALDQRREWLFTELYKDKPEELLYLQRLYNDPTIHGGSGGKDRAFIHFGGVQKSYKSMKGGIADFGQGYDGYMQNKPGEHY
jgi:hypothetical protein